MDRASSLLFPGGRIVAGWWRQLARWQPAGMWIGYAYVHRIDAEVEVRAEATIDSFTHLILQAIHFDETNAGGVSAAQVQARLGLPAGVVQSLLKGIGELGLLTRLEPDRWRTSDIGLVALERRTYPTRQGVRRVFPFVERIDASGARVDVPHFVPLAECAAAAWTVNDAHRFDVGALQACIAQDAEWKQAHGFPHDVESLPRGDGGEAWRRVVVDRAERVMLVLIHADADGKRELVGFAAKADGWVLHDRDPVLRLPDGEGVWPEVVRATPPSVWQDAWRTWCKSRQLPDNEVEICSLNHHPPRLDVQAPPRLLQRLQSAKSDIFKGEAWILAGDGYFRVAAQLAVKQSY